MSVAISSFFKSKLSATTVNSIIKRVYIGSNVLSGYLDFGSVTYTSRDVIGGDMSINLDAAESPDNTILLSRDKSFLLQPTSMQFGFKTTGGGEDLIEFFKGEFREARYSKGKVQIRLKNLLYGLGKKEVGTVDSPVDFTGSNYNPADLVWTVQVSYGLLSDIKSSSNPDIDYNSWLTWHDTMAGDSITVKAYFDGQTVPEILEKTRDLTDSLIWEGTENKLFYARWTGATSETHIVADSHIIGDPEIIETADSILNQITVKLNYNVTSDSWGGEITRINSSSVNSFGTQDFTFDDKKIWFSTSATAINLADRLVFRRKEPNVSIKVPVNFDFIDTTLNEIGENVEFSWGMYGIDRKQMTLLGMEFDFDKFILTLDIDEGFGFSSGRAFGFILDDNNFGLLDASNNPLF